MKRPATPGGISFRTNADLANLDWRRVHVCPDPRETFESSDEP
ncbi:unannotated protein [freshwater metagenome]|uniref:Unannotated protein n=1 Tax=freshwater metagenome TaxID=449393 RepID=A0A6J6WB43_9ZZZZ